MCYARSLISRFETKTKRANELNQFVFVPSLSVRKAQKRGEILPMMSLPPKPPRSASIPRDVFERIQKFHNNGAQTKPLKNGGGSASHKISLNVAGGCASAIQWLLAVPNASRTILCANVLYSRESVVHALDDENEEKKNVMRESFCDRETSKDLARAAYRKAIETHYTKKSYMFGRKEEESGNAKWTTTARHILGVGATSAFVSTPPKRGEHRCFVSVYSKFGVTTRKVTLDKESERSRAEEDRVASECLVRAAIGDGERWMKREEEEEGEVDDASFSEREDGEDESWKAFREGALTCKDDRLEFLEYDAPWFEKANEKMNTKKSLLERWLDVGRTMNNSGDGSGSSSSSSSSDDKGGASRNTPERSVYSMHGGKLETIGCSTANVVLSGSFNPVHEGHRGMLEAATTYLREKRNREKTEGGEDERAFLATPAFELSISNADKGQLETNVVVQRAKQFDSDGQNRLILTRDAPLFSQKAKLLPNTTFVVGYDTAVRLVDPKYYDDNADVMVRELRKIKDAQNCAFLVCGRKDDTSSSSNAFKTLKDIRVPDAVSDVFEALENFRIDISSTEIRRKLKP